MMDSEFLGNTLTSNNADHTLSLGRSIGFIKGSGYDLLFKGIIAT